MAPVAELASTSHVRPKHVVLAVLYSSVAMSEPVKVWQPVPPDPMAYEAALSLELRTADAPEAPRREPVA